jgi:hypothetical protein
MNWLRKCAGGVFGFEALLLLPALPMSVWILLRQTGANPYVNLVTFLWGSAGVTLVGIPFACAWWTIRTGARSAASWGVAASALNILFSLPILYALRSVSWDPIWLLPIAGFAGIYVFTRKFDPPTAKRKAEVFRPIPGDGTNRILTKVASFLALAGAVGGILWWLQWTTSEGIPRSHGVILYLEILGLLLISTFIHEAGHSVVGWGLGMKIRHFEVGPFRWRIREGKWEFRFNPKAILAGGGAAGMVPVTANEPIWCKVFMVAGGPLANLLSAMIALGVYLEPSSEPTPARGLFVLFGIYSLLGFAFNMVPQPGKRNYSDGAQIYQLLAGGPWADMHHVTSLVGSSLVTPLRPRDYDIELICSAASGMREGRKGILMRIHAYSHHLDCCQLPEAREALRQAESICDNSALELPFGLHTVFVFGNAYLNRDASGARRWWDRMEAKKPKRFNSDYWMAHSALHWMEGNLAVANESWHKGDAVAQKLPKAGAYEFDRYCLSLLRVALDEAALGEVRSIAFAEA